jgi:histidine triad (HIT) family protein
MVARSQARHGASAMSESNECIFCKIVRGDFGTEFVAESANAVAFRDIDPKSPTHVLVVPRQHFESLRSLGIEEAMLTAELLGLVNEVARRVGIDKSGYRVLTNVGPDAGQSVPHLHFHIMGGHTLSAGLG